MALFNPRYRKGLQDKWDTSKWKRFNMVLGTIIYSLMLFIALLVWIPPLIGGANKKTFDAQPKEVPSIEIEFTPEEIDRLKDTKKFNELLDVAGGFIDQKLKEKKEKDGE